MAIQYELLKNHLGDEPKGYHALVCNQRIYNRKEIIEMMLNRGTLLTSTDIEAVLACLEDVIKQVIKNGEGLNTGIFTMRIDIKGRFPDPNSHFDKAHNNLAINMTASKSLKESLEDIELERVYSSGKEAQITMVEDINSQKKDSVLTPAGPLKVWGNRIKISASAPVADNQEGLYAVNIADDTATKFGTEINNKPSELIYIVPSLTAGKYKLEVRTYNTGSSVGKLLKVITSEATFTVS